MKVKDVTLYVHTRLRLTSSTGHVIVFPPLPLVLSVCLSSLALLPHCNNEEEMAPSVAAVRKKREAAAVPLLLDGGDGQQDPVSSRCCCEGEDSALLPLQ